MSVNDFEPDDVHVRLREPGAFFPFALPATFARTPLGPSAVSSTGTSSESVSSAPSVPKEVHTACPVSSDAVKRIFSLTDWVSISFQHTSRVAGFFAHSSRNGAATSDDASTKDHVPERSGGWVPVEREVVEPAVGSPPDELAEAESGEGGSNRHVGTFDRWGRSSRRALRRIRRGQRGSSPPVMTKMR